MSTISKIMLNAASGAGGGDTYWITRMGGSSSEQWQDNAIDSQNNIIAVGYTYTDGEGDADFLVTKYDPDGNTLWAVTLGNGYENFARGVCVDSSDNIYVSGYTSGSTAGGTDILIVKYNSSGVVQWQRIIGDNSGQTGWRCVTDSSDNVYVCGSSDSSSYHGWLVKWNSSGTFQWRKHYGPYSGGRKLFYDIAIDYSDGITVVGFDDNAMAWLVVGFNTSGTVTREDTFRVGSNYNVGTAVCVDASRNVYIIGEDNTDSGVLAFVKTTRTGTTYFDRKFYSSEGTWETSDDGACDSDYNFYICGVHYNGSNDDIVIVKYNGSGAVQWKRTLSSSSYDSNPRINIDSRDNIIITFSSTGGTNNQGSYDCWTIKLPSDGSGTGTYAGFTYADFSGTNSALSGSWTARSYGTSDMPYTEQSYSAVENDISAISENFTQIEL